MGVVVKATPLPFDPPGKVIGSYLTGGWVGLGTSLDGCGEKKSTSSHLRKSKMKAKESESCKITNTFRAVQFPGRITPCIQGVSKRALQL
jgi:hypothetical protein